MNQSPDQIRVLVFGKHGQVGGQLVAQLSGREDLKVIAADIEDVDLTNDQATSEFVQDSAADWVLNTSAHTAVDRAEQEQGLARQLNGVAPGVIAMACHRIKAAMVHYSTDYVFDGSASEPYVESDLPNPKSVYGKTKLEGEQAVLKALDNALIFRTAWVYSRHGKSFVNTMLRLASDRDELNVVCDQFGSPTLADDLASATISVVDQLVAKPSESSWGTYHVTGSGVTNWSGFAESIFQLSGLERVVVNPIPTSEYPTPAPRPAYSVLSNEKLKKVFSIELPHWQDALERCLT